MTSTHEFNERVQRYYNAAGAYAERIYDSDGIFTAKTKRPEVRERYWLAFSLYASGRTALADGVIRNGDLTVDHMGNKRDGVSTWDIFHSNIAAMLLKQHGDVMSEDVRRILIDLVIEATATGGRNRGADFQFHGYNDNMPAKAAMGLIVGGEYVGDSSAVEHGLHSLRALRAMLTRRGTVSEYNSPTYSAVTLHALAEIAEHAASDEARDLARQAEARLWVDIAARFHPEMGVIVGPHSRAYTVDLIASVSCVSSMLWFVLGDQVKASPMLLFENDPKQVIHHGGDYPFNVAQMCWFASGSYHVPALAQAMFEGKHYPFAAEATFECGNVNPDFPARNGSIKSYLQPDYAVGTSDTTWLGGEQCAAYFATYKQRHDVRSHKDVGTVYTKLVIDDGVPGATHEAPCSETAEEDNLQSRSGSLVVQSESTALVLTHPHLTLAAHQDWPNANPQPIHELSELIVFPSHWHGADEIMVGDKHVSAWSGTVPTNQWIACRRGQLLAAFKPIAYSRDFGQAAIALEHVNNYDIIRAIFYAGAERAFTRDELRHICGGFVAEHASADEFPTLAAFVDALKGSTVSDFVQTTRRTRYIRPLTRLRPALDIETSWSLASSSNRYATVNGSLIGVDRMRIDGIDNHQLPFLRETIDSTATWPLPFAPFPMQWAKE